MKTETELLNDYVSGKFPDTKPEHYLYYADTVGFKFYLLKNARKDLKSAIITDLPPFMLKLFKGSSL